jgi:DNA-directed RNA polymerase subunit RPC12/RpoP
MRKIITNNKPTRFDGHLVYTCQECGTEAYVSLPEALTEGFIVVCAECNTVLKLKPIKEVRVDFIQEPETEKKQEKQKSPEPPPPPPVPEPTITEGLGDIRLEQPLTNSDPVLESGLALVEDQQETMIPDHFYDDIPEKFQKENTAFVIQEIPDEVMPVLESVVITLKKYGYSHDDAARLTYAMARSDINRKWTTKDLAAEVLKQEKEVIIHVK